MNKKNLFILLALVVVIFIAALVIFPALNKINDTAPNDQNQNGGQDNDQDDNQGDTGLANPASVYCEAKGGILEIREFIGGQKGFCIFEDGSECDEWKFFRNECRRGTVFCKDFCGDGICQQMVCAAVGCPCAETAETCHQDCLWLTK